MIIFFSNFINLGGVLYLKSFEISVITLNLNYPLSTILNLTIFNFIIIFSHLIYIKSLEELERNVLLKKYELIINSLKSEKTKSFIELYCGNNALNTKELAEVVPIYL